MTTHRRRPRGAVRLLAISMMAAGVVLASVAAYLLWGTGAYTADAQRQLDQQLRRTQVMPERKQPATDRPDKHVTPASGEPFAAIRIPALGRDYRYVVVEGTSTADLRKGPGHFRGSAWPGQLGNFVVSGHRTTYRAPFGRIDELRRGDTIVIDTAQRQYVYRVTTTEIVQPDEIGVTYPVPRRPDARADIARITLTTCHPKYSASQRLIVSGVLLR